MALICRDVAEEKRGLLRNIEVKLTSMHDGIHTDRILSRDKGGGP